MQYNEFSEPNPTIKEFREDFERVASECSIDGITVNSHTLKSAVRVRLDDPDDDTSFEIVGIDVDQLIGCGCWSDVVIMIKKVKDERKETDTPSVS